MVTGEYIKFILNSLYTLNNKGQVECIDKAKPYTYVVWAELFLRFSDPESLPLW